MTQNFDSSLTKENSLITDDETATNDEVEDAKQQANEKIEIESNKDLKKKRIAFKEFNSKFGLPIICFVLASLFLGNCFIPYFAIPAFAIVLVCVLFYNIKDALSFIFFSIPFCCLWVPVSVVMLMASLVVYLVRIFIHNYKLKKLKFSKSLLITLGLLAVYLVFPFKNFYNGMLAIKILAMFAIFVLIYLCLNNKEELRINFNVGIFACGLIFASIYFHFVYPLGGYLYEILPIFKIFGGNTRFAALFLNTNVLAMSCEMGIGILTYYFITDRFGYFEIFAFSILMILGLLTFSKTFMIIFAVMAIILVIFAIKNFKSNGWKVLVMLFAGIMFVGVVRWNAISIYFQRFLGDNSLSEIANKPTNDILNIVTTSRYELWVAYIKDMLANPAIIFFGKGLGTPTLPNLLSPHNLYISLIYQVGLVGVGLIVCAIVYLVKYAIKNSNFVFNKYSIVSMIAFALLFIVEDLIFFIY